MLDYFRQRGDQFLKTPQRFAKLGGLEQRSRVMNRQERQTVAFHECGHALVAV
jgi:hypothetical protein